MTIKEALLYAKNELNCERKALIAEILLAWILDKDRIYLHAHDDENIDKRAQNRFFKCIKKINRAYPLEYMIKRVSFFSTTFFIDEGALIPRPESEILIIKANNLIKRKKIQNLYEIGTGSGILAIMLCVLNKGLRATCTDISSRALKIAQKNIEIHSKRISRDLNKQIKLVKTSLLNNINWDKNSLIIANPPYINKDYILPKNLEFEPKRALFGGKNGDEMLKKIIDLSPKYLCCEIGYDQKYIKKYLDSYDYIRFYKDYSARWRGFVAYKK